MIQADRAANFKTQALIALSIIGSCALLRTIFCFTMPTAIISADIFEINIDRLIVSIPFVIIGYYLYLVKNFTRLGMLVMAPGLYIQSSIFSFRMQIAVFHVGKDFPLIDNLLGRIDKFFLFDWPGYFHWVVAHDSYRQIISIAYQSIWIQPLLLFGAFILGKRPTSYFTLQVALPLSLAITCAIAAFVPSLEAYQFHQMGADDHAHTLIEFTDRATAPIMWLRQTELPSVMPDFPELRLVSFPSWHAATAIIFLISAWQMPNIRYIFAVLNFLMLLATPFEGSHYGIDVVAGLMVGYGSQVISRFLLKFRYGNSLTCEIHTTEHRSALA